MSNQPETEGEQKSKKPAGIFRITNRILFILSFSKILHLNNNVYQHGNP
jgi:hypothetical protein